MSALFDFSQALAAAVAAAAGRVVRVQDKGRSLSGILWREGLVVTAEECLSGRRRRDADAARRDARSRPSSPGGTPPTDVALLRAATGPVTPGRPAPPPAAGALALAVGRGASGPLAAHGIVAEAGPAWTSSAGGAIDALVRLGFALPHRIEGGAAVDAEGRLIGLAVADPRRRGLVIPTSTVERAAAALAEKGRVGRGYLGLAMQPLRGGGGPG